MVDPTDLIIMKRSDPFIPTKIKVCIYAVENYSFKEEEIDEYCLKHFNDEKKKSFEEFNELWKKEEDETRDNLDLNIFR